MTYKTIAVILQVSRNRHAYWIALSRLQLASERILSASMLKSCRFHTRRRLVFLTRISSSGVHRNSTSETTLKLVGISTNGPEDSGVSSEWRRPSKAFPVTDLYPTYPSIPPSGSRHALARRCWSDGT